MSHTDNRLSLQHVWDTTLPSENAEEKTGTSVPPIRGMSIFSLATEPPIPLIRPGETRICSGAYIPPATTKRHRPDPCATFNGKRPEVQFTPARQQPHVIESITRKSDQPTVATILEREHFSIADSMNAAKPSFLRPIGDAPLSQKPAPAFQTTHIEAIPLPQNYDLEQLSAWHKEREGHEPHTISATPVWLKRENGSWACAANATWPQLFEPLLQKIKQQQQKLDTLRATQHAQWPYKNTQPA